jgi:dTDP-4-amino-4,6-dideoxy-D-galactose acyltransferase
MTELLEALPWDTEFFGKRIGRVKAGSITDETLAAAVAAGRQAELDCMYLTVGRRDALSGVPERAGFHLVDVQIHLERRLQGASPARELSEAVVRPGTLSDIPLLRPVIDALAPWSRFAVDPRFGAQAAGDMYEAWIEKSARAGQDLFAVATIGSDLVGVVTVEGGHVPKIVLIGASASGMGIGTLLMNAAVDWTVPQAEVMMVTTQERNVDALRFYARHGFEVTSDQNVYHLWLDS